MLTVCKVAIPSADFGGESTLPSLYEMSNNQQMTKFNLDEDDELFIGYGALNSIFPYRMQDLYNREEKDVEYTAVVLENKYLKAVFLPEFGGRMWSLFDKEKGRELLYENPVVKPCNLALRNAWMAGGIEFNCGMIGHSPFTCACIHAAQTQLSDGTPVLRMYEYERIRNAVYQMDFFLPEDSKVLFGRMRIVNPTLKTVPMYWWTNIALREDREARNVIDATVTYNNRNNQINKNPVPFDNGVDITYPTNNPIAVDFFWKIPQNKRKYTAYLDKEGYGFFQTSTSRLIGRKLFVWGQGDGSKHWQEFLTRDGHDGRYIEIQAGLAHTQYECVPMPPKAAWEWLEVYGAVTADAKKVHGEWDECRGEVGDRIEEKIGAQYLEDLLVSTKEMALSPAEKQICRGSGWGALENLRRKSAGEEVICPHLDFDTLDSKQELWQNLLEKGVAKSQIGDSEPPASWMLQDEWTAILEKSEDCHQKYLHLAAIYLAKRRIEDSDRAIEKALSFAKTSSALFLKSQIYRLRDEISSAALTALEAYKLSRDDLSLARQTFALCLAAKKYNDIIDVYEKADDKIKKDGRAAMSYAFALLYVGKIERAEAVLYRDGGLLITDIRECEESVTALYIEIQKAKAKRDGKSLSDEQIEVPRQFDFRMFIPEKKKR